MGTSIKSTTKRKRYYRKKKNTMYNKLLRKIEGQKELKYFDTIPIALPVTVYYGNYHLAQLTSIGQGVGNNQIVGEKLRISGLQLRVSLARPITANSPTYITARVMLFQDMNQSSAIPVLSDFMQNSEIVSPYRFETRKRMKCLCDKVVSLDVDDVTADIVCNVNKFGTSYIRFWGAPIVSTHTEASGHLYILIMTDPNATSTYPIVVEYQSRLTFYDD